MGADEAAAGSNSSGGRGRLLIVEDEELIALYLVEILDELGFQVCGHASCMDDAVALADTHRPALALVDVRLRGEEDGVTTAHELKSRFGVPSLLLSGAIDDDLRRRAADIPAAGFLLKPYTVRQLETTIDQILAEQ